MFRIFEKSKKRVGLLVYGEIEEEYNNAEDFVSLLISLESMYTTIDLHINCVGGDVFQGNAMYTAIKRSKAKINIYIDGLAASMITIIMYAIPKERIYMVGNGLILIHAPQGGAYGTARRMLEAAKLLRGLERIFYKIYQKVTGKSEKDATKYMDGGDYWFTADEAAKEGLINKENIIDAVEDIELPEPGNRDPKSIYKRYAAALKNNYVSPNKNEMDTKDIIARFNLTGVTAESSDTAVLDALSQKLEKEKNKREELENEIKKNNTAAVKNAVKNAVKEGKIKDSVTEKYEQIGEKMGLEHLNGIMAELTPYQDVNSKVKGKKEGKESKKGETDREDWGWDEYQKNDVEALEQMKVKDPEKFHELYNAKYKTNY